MEVVVPLILIADANANDRALIRNILADSAYFFIEVKDGQRALAAIRTYHPALAIIDILVPLIDGRQLCQIIKAEEGLRATRIILITAFSSSANRFNAFDVGCDTLITKSSVTATLKQTVVRLLSS